MTAWRQRAPHLVFPDASELEEPLLDVQDLRTAFRTARGLVRANDGISFTLGRGKTLGVVGESGSGKTVLTRSLMGLLPPVNLERSGSVRFAGHELMNLSQVQLRDVWGTQMAVIFQDPMTALNPVVRVDRQLTESLRIRLGLDRRAARDTAIALLTSVGIPAPEQRMRNYPHELSGGMRQRVMIAIALACGPKLVLADEPTTGLDVTLQAQILDLLATLQRERAMGMILVTHDLGVVANRADDIAVMYAGRIVEQAPTKDLFPHPYALHRGAPAVDPPTQRTQSHPAPGHPRTAPRSGRPPPGCPFAPRCPYVQDRCRTEDPPARTAGARPHLPLLVPGGLARRGGTPWPATWPPLSRPPGLHRRRSRGPAGHHHHHRRRHGRYSRRRQRLQPIDGDRDGGGKLMAGSGTAQLRGDDMLLRVEHLVVEFGKARRRVRAVSDVSFDVAAGETLGLVGESGCGKSTTGRATAPSIPRTPGGPLRRDRNSTTPAGRRLASACDQGPDGLPGSHLLAQSPTARPRLGHGTDGHLGRGHP